MGNYPDGDSALRFVEILAEVTEVDVYRMAAPGFIGFSIPSELDIVTCGPEPAISFISARGMFLPGQAVKIRVEKI